MSDDYALDDDLEAAFRALDPKEPYEFTARGPLIWLVFRFEDPPEILATDDAWRAIEALPEDLREPLRELCLAMAPHLRPKQRE